MNIDKKLPHNKNLEEAVIGALIVESEAIVKVSDILTPEVFYIYKNQQLYKAISNMNEANIPVDLITLYQYLVKHDYRREVADPDYIAYVSSKIAQAAHIEVHAVELKEKYIRRQIINISYTITTDAFAEQLDTEDILSKFTKKIEDIFIDKKGGATKFNEVLDDLFEETKEKQGNIEIAEGFRSDINNVKDFVPVWGANKMIVVAARPSMGKTANALHEVRNALKQKKNVAFFSLEMTKKELARRLLNAESNIDSFYFEVNDLNSYQWEKLDRAYDETKNYSLWIDDSTYSLTGIKNQARILHKKVGLGALFIDYLQLIEGNKELSREQQVAQISRDLKLLAKELNIPLFLLAQLNRKSEDRKEDGYKPRISDLRESGAVEQDADIIYFPHRADYYEPGNKECWLIFGKNRGGKTGAAEVRTNETKSVWKDPDKTEFVNQVMPPFERDGLNNEIPFNNDEPF